MNERIFHAFKKAIDGSALAWGFVPDLTHEEARDLNRFPGGAHFDDRMKVQYVWTYALMPRYVAQLTMPAPSRSVPSAAVAILGKLASK